ncbi:hypothetical protein OHA70_36815 [Kribbella sp. NBC_00382]|uniref:hypothetical protein n=1 Tax=Kribbella sp. NBC_00382 TaxID=2975967 RepID=UPI002E21DD9C
MGTVITIIVIVLVVLVAAAALYTYQRRRTEQLQERFGPEYERTLEQSGDRKEALRDLRGREQRRAKLDVHPLSGESAERYRAEWSGLQKDFVDAPGDAVAQADRLVLRMMREAGYPVDDFDQRADDISVDHPEVAQNYRQAHSIAVAQTQGPVDTEDLRQAVTAYRRLVVVLLENPADLNGHTDTKEQHS